MTGQAFIFINYLQALRFGHVAWGFALGNGRYCYGSSDHLLKRPMSDLIALARYSHVPAGGDIDFWCEEGSYDEMIAAMASGHHIRYHACKRIGDDSYRFDGNVEAARLAVEAVKVGGWSVLKNNCIHHTYQILKAYGVDDNLLVPTLLRPWSMLPKKWFKHAAGQSIVLRPTTAILARGGN